MPPAPTPSAANALHDALGLLGLPAVAVGPDWLVIDANGAGAAKLSVALPAALGRVASDIIPELAWATRLVLTEAAAGTVILVWPDGDGVTAAAVEQQKADMLSRLAGGISHDLANALGPILTMSSMIATDPGVPLDLQESAALLQHESERTLRLVRDTLELARRRPPARSRVALGPLVRECMGLTANAMMSLNKETSVSEVMPELDLDIACLRQAVLAVLVTAVEAMGGTWVQGGAPATGSLCITGYLAEEDGRYRARLTFEDSGAVVPEAQRATLFSGVGERSSRDLAVAFALIRDAGGRMVYEPLPDGNRIVVELPLAGDPPLSREAPKVPGSPAMTDARPLLPFAGSAATPSPTAREAGAPVGPTRTSGAALTVLVCDDEPSIRTLLARVITRGGHHAREASGGAEALELLEAEPVDLVIADQRMADMTGVDLYRAAVARRPELATRFVLMSGDAGTAELVEFATATGLQVIEKPFNLNVVKTTLERLSKS